MQNSRKKEFVPGRQNVDTLYQFVSSKSGRCSGIGFTNAVYSSVIKQKHPTAVVLVRCSQRERLIDRVFCVGSMIDSKACCLWNKANVSVLTKFHKQNNFCRILFI